MIWDFQSFQTVIAARVDLRHRQRIITQVGPLWRIQEKAVAVSLQMKVWESFAKEQMELKLQLCVQTHSHQRIL